MDVVKFKDRLVQVMEYLLRKDPVLYKTRAGVGTAIGFTPTNLSSALNGNARYLTEGLAKKFADAFPELSYSWLISGSGSMLKNDTVDNFLSHLPDPEPKINPTKEDVLNQLNYIKKKKDITTNKTHAIFHQITAYVLPVVGRLGLGVEMYSDAYFENELTKVTIPIKNKENNVKRYILAEFKGESMTNPELPEENIRDGAFVLLAEREKGSAWTEFIKKGKIMGFYDNDKNFTIKKVKSFRPDIGELCLEAINPDKTKDDNKDRCVELKNLWALYDYLGEQTF